MRIDIKPLYLGGCFYRIAVLTDGSLWRTYAATASTVLRKRNQLYDYWCKNAKEVHAGEIPKATDMRTKGQAK